MKLPEIPEFATAEAAEKAGHESIAKGHTYLAVACRMRSTPSDYLDGQTSEEEKLMTDRAFQDAARRGDFPSIKGARGRMAKRADVLAFLERRTQRKAKPTEDLEAAYAAATRRAGAR